MRRFLLSLASLCLLLPAIAKKRYGLELELGARRANQFLDGKILDAKTKQPISINSLTMELMFKPKGFEKNIIIMIDGVERTDFNVLWDTQYLEIKYRDDLEVTDKAKFKKDFENLARLTGSTELIKNGSQGQAHLQVAEPDHASFHIDFSTDEPTADFSRINERANALHMLELMEKGLGDYYLSNPHSIDFNPEIKEKGVLRQRNPRRTELRVFPAAHLDVLDRYENWTSQDSARSEADIEELLAGKLSQLRNRYSSDAEGNLPLLAESLAKIFSASEASAQRLSGDDWKLILSRVRPESKKALEARLKEIKSKKRAKRGKKPCLDGAEDARS